jgi:hypothetical protein
MTPLLLLLLRPLVLLLLLLQSAGGVVCLVCVQQTAAAGHVKKESDDKKLSTDKMVDQSILAAACNGAEAFAVSNVDKHSSEIAALQMQDAPTQHSGDERLKGTRLACSCYSDNKKCRTSWSVLRLRAPLH